MDWEPLITTLGLAAPVVLSATVAIYLQWARVKRARLRAERQRLPNSTEPPAPIPWYSLRPEKRVSARRKGDLQ